MHVRICLAILMMCMISTYSQTDPNSYSIKIHTGQELQALIPFVAQQRIVLFAEYPYLYEADLEKEFAYLNLQAKLKHSALAVAYYNNEPVGFLSGTSFVDFEDHFKGSIELFKNAGLEAARYYYFPEIIIVPAHRGWGLSRQLFAALEKHAQALGFSAVCLNTESHDQHPLKPKNYKELDSLWHTLGYTKSSVAINFSWPTKQVGGSVAPQEHRLEYWVKDFEKE